MTLKQKKALSNVVENGGNVSKAMIDAGYSPATAKTPQKLTESKAFMELYDEYLPNELLAEKHRELLTVPKKVRTFIKGDLTSEYEELDSQAISKGLDMAYKLKGSYAPDKSISLNVTADITPQNEKAKALADKYEAELLDSIQG